MRPNHFIPLAVKAGGGIERGELVMTPDMPISSPVPEAWRRWCEWAEIDHAVREMTFEDLLRDLGLEEVTA